jgi:hypothetical protein
MAKEQPQFSSELFIVTQAIVRHPVRPKRDKQKVANRDAARYWIVFKI